MASQRASGTRDDAFIARHHATPPRFCNTLLDGNPALWINGKNVVEPFGIAMPEMSGSLLFGFGAGINPFSLTGFGESFTVIFERAELREL